MSIEFTLNRIRNNIFNAKYLILQYSPEDEARMRRMEKTMETISKNDELLKHIIYESDGLHRVKQLYTKYSAKILHTINSVSVSSGFC